MSENVKEIKINKSWQVAGICLLAFILLGLGASLKKTTNEPVLLEFEGGETWLCEQGDTLVINGFDENISFTMERTHVYPSGEVKFARQGTDLSGTKFRIKCNYIR